MNSYSQAEQDLVDIKYVNQLIANNKNNYKLSNNNITDKIIHFKDIEYLNYKY